MPIDTVAIVFSHIMLETNQLPFSFLNRRSFWVHLKWSFLSKQAYVYTGMLDSQPSSRFWATEYHQYCGCTIVTIVIKIPVIFSLSSSKLETEFKLSQCNLCQVRKNDWNNDIIKTRKVKGWSQLRHRLAVILKGLLIMSNLENTLSVFDLLDVDWQMKSPSHELVLAVLDWSRVDFEESG